MEGQGDFALLISLPGMFSLAQLHDFLLYSLVLSINYNFLRKAFSGHPPLYIFSVPRTVLITFPAYILWFLCILNYLNLDFTCTYFSLFR